MNLQWRDAVIASGISGTSAIDCEANNIHTVTAAVLSSTGTDILAKGEPWLCHWHHGDIKSVPVGQHLIVEVRALDAANRVLYYGRTLDVDIRKGYVTPVVVTLEAVDTTPVVSLVRDLSVGAAGSFPQQLKAFGDRLYFVARQPDIGFELFGTDGTDAGTVLIKDIYPYPAVAPSFGEMPEPSDMTECNGQLYFIADDGINGPALWQTDGTPENTFMMVGFETTGAVNPSHLIALNNTLFFSAEEGASGRELWQSDGTALGTRLVYDIHDGLESSNPHELTAMRNWLYFVADDGQRGYEIWRTDGTVTALVQDIAQTAVTGTPGNTQDSFASDLTVVNGRLFFRAVEDSSGEEIWMITADDTSARADLVVDLNAYSNRSSRPRSLTAIDDTFLAFSAEQILEGETESQTGSELWLFDWLGSAVPFRVTDINPGSAKSSPRNFISMGNQLYFTANSPRDEEHLWSWPIGTTDAPTCLTAALVDPAPRHLTVFDGRLYFTAFEDRYGRELWYWDGATSARVDDLCPDAGSSFPSNLTVVGDRLFFSAYEPVNGKELYRLVHEYEVVP